MGAWTRLSERASARWRVFAAAAAVAAVVAPAAYFASADSGGIRTVSIMATSQPGQLGRYVPLTVDGRARHYRLFAAPPTRPGPRPLLIALHPLHSTVAHWEEIAHLDGPAAARDVVVAYPAGVGHSWDAGTCCGYATQHRINDVRFILRVVADVERHVWIDRRRVAVTGFSNGALMSYRLVCERPDVFSVAVAVAGDMVAPRCAPSKPVAMLHVHGVRDSVIPLAGNSSSYLDRYGFPSAAASIERIASADGCHGATVTRGTGTVVWRASGCPAAAPVELVTAATLVHHYPNGAYDARLYGVDMRVLTWQFLKAVWGS